jgi:hypothetical protein
MRGDSDTFPLRLLYALTAFGSTGAYDHERMNGCIVQVVLFVK